MKFRAVRRGDEEALLGFYKSFEGIDANHFRPWQLTLEAMANHIARAETGADISLVAVDQGDAIVGHAFIKNADPRKARTLTNAGEGEPISLFVKAKRMCGRCLRLLLAAMGRRAKPRFGIGILSSQRGRGLSKELMGAVLEEARRRSMPRVTLGVHKRNIPSVRMCKSMGFRITGDLTQQEHADSHEMVLEFKEGASTDRDALD